MESLRNGRMMTTRALCRVSPHPIVLVYAVRNNVMTLAVRAGRARKAVRRLTLFLTTSFGFRRTRDCSRAHDHRSQYCLYMYKHIITTSLTSSASPHKSSCSRYLARSSTVW